MFQAAVRPPIPFTGLANQAFDERLVALTSRRSRIAYYSDTPDTATFRYRVLNMVQALAGWPEGRVSASWFCRADLGEMHRFVDRADALVICRALYRPAIEQMVIRAKARQIPVVFDCDDLVFDLSYVPLVMSSLDLDLNQDKSLKDWYGKVARYAAVMRLCDRAIATNPILSGRMESSSAGRMRAQVIPNFLQEAQQTVSTELYEAKRDSGFRSDGTITIGYFSGSPTHNRDFAVAVPALARLMDQEPRVRLRVVGFLDANGGLENYGSRVEFYPLQDPLNLQRLTAEVEINIAPLQNNLFTNCKSELKYFEAAIAGTITVATPTYAFSHAIADGENGFLARAMDWDEKLRAACAVVDDPARYADIARRAFAMAERDYGWNRHAALITATVLEPGSVTDTEPRSAAEEVSTPGS